MKLNFFTIAFVTGLILILATGCKEPVRKKIVGIWLIEDIKISGDTNTFDMGQFRKATEDQKRLRFEMRADSSVSIYTGAAEIDGIWWYERSKNKVFVRLEGNRKPTLLGTYQEGKLVNKDTTGVGAIISTIFIKEIPEKDSINQ